MANARIGNDAAWTAIRAFAAAATGIPLAAVYQQAQNAPEIPRIEIPDAVTRNVTAAASRVSGTWNAATDEPENAPISASPATDWIRIGGARDTKPVTAPAAKPKST